MIQHSFLSWGVICLFLLGAGGCAGTSSANREEEERPEKIYSGLTGQTCAVMVWADWHTRTEYSQIQLDLARMIQERLIARLNKDGESGKASADVMKFPYSPASVVRFQREHPETETAPIAQIAPRLGVSRVIFIELTDFQAQSPESIMILKGLAKANLRVLEVKGGAASIVFEEAGLTVLYPSNAPEGVVASDKWNVRTIYAGTLGRLAEKVALRFER